MERFPLHVTGIEARQRCSTVEEAKLKSNLQVPPPRCAAFRSIDYAIPS